jgi:hypothetical protein
MDARLLDLPGFSLRDGTRRDGQADPGVRVRRIAIGAGIAIPVLLIVAAAIALTSAIFSSSGSIRASDVEGTWVDEESVVLVLGSDGSAKVDGLTGQSASGVSSVVRGEGTWRLTTPDRVQVLLGNEADRMFVDLYAERQLGTVRLMQFSGDPDDPRSARVLEMMSAGGQG